MGAIKIPQDEYKANIQLIHSVILTDQEHFELMEILKVAHRLQERKILSINESIAYTYLTS